MSAVLLDQHPADLARSLIGATLLLDGVGGLIVETVLGSTWLDAPNRILAQAGPRL